MDFVMIALSPKREIAIVVIGLATAFAFGRYSVNQPTIKTVETVKTDEDKKEDTSTHTRVKTTVVKQPNGAETTTTISDTTVASERDTKLESNTQIQQTVTTSKQSKLNVSFLAGIDRHQVVGIVPTYGLSVQKEFIGPITIGLWGLTDGVYGVSIGLDF